VPAKLYALTCGHLTIPTAFLLADREGATRVPITSYLIEHPKGRAISDSGMHIAAQVTPADHVGDLLAAGIVADRDAATTALKRLRDMQSRGATIMYGHDLEFWESVPQAPARLA
jgi:N-acyl homoserine lactone hydrolase